MTKPASTSKTSRKQYTPEFRDVALKLGECIGVAAAARELSLYESQHYNWRSKQPQQLSSSDRENVLAAENVRLKRQLAEPKNWLFSKRPRHTSRSPEMKYVFIEKHQSEFSIKAMCGVLRVSRSGWYVWRSVIVRLIHVNSSGSFVLRLSVTHSLRQNSAIVRRALLMSCRSITLKPSLPVCVVRGAGESQP